MTRWRLCVDWHRRRRQGYPPATRAVDNLSTGVRTFPGLFKADSGVIHSIHTPYYDYEYLLFSKRITGRTQHLVDTRDPVAPTRHETGLSPALFPIGASWSPKTGFFGRRRGSRRIDGRPRNRAIRSWNAFAAPPRQKTAAVPGRRRPRSGLWPVVVMPSVGFVPFADKSDRLPLYPASGETIDGQGPR